jgi:three-Cys-motif partner protein
MTRFWGDDSWGEVVYRDDPQGHFWGDAEKIKVENANKKIAEAYRRRLIDVAGFRFAPAPLPFLNSQGATIYYLFFASHNQTGDKIVQQIFDKYRRRKWL